MGWPYRLVMMVRSSMMACNGGWLTGISSTACIFTWDMISELSYDGGISYVPGDSIEFPGETVPTEDPSLLWEWPFDVETGAFFFLRGFDFWECIFPPFVGDIGEPSLFAWLFLTVRLFFCFCFGFVGCRKPMEFGDGMPLLMVTLPGLLTRYSSMRRTMSLCIRSVATSRGSRSMWSVMSRLA